MCESYTQSVGGCVLLAASRFPLGLKVGFSNSLFLFAEVVDEVVESGMSPRVAADAWLIRIAEDRVSRALGVESRRLRS